MPPLVAAAAITAAGAIGGGAIAAKSAGSAANTQSDAAANAARLQTEAQNHAADIQGKSAAETLAFQKEQSALDAQRYEAAQRGNYGQYVSRVRGAQALGNTIGFSLPDAAPYVSATGGGSSASPGGAASGPAPAVDASKGDLAGQISGYFKARGVPDTETPYWVQKWQEFGSKDPAYFNQRLSQADIFGGGGGQTAPAPRMLPNSIASYLPPTSTNPAAYTPQVQPFQLRSINAFMR